MSELIKGEQIAAAARSFVGIPFRHLGRDHNGMDCVGLIICVCRACGLVASGFDETNYSRTPNNRILLRKLTENGLFRASPIYASGVFCTFQLGREPMHLGIIDCPPPGIGELLYLVHADGSAGKVVRHRLSLSWKKRVTSFWRFSELEVRY